MRSRFLSFIPFVLCNLMAPDTGGAAGGSADPQPESPTGDTPEAKYTSALKIIGDYFKQLSGAFKERDDAVAQVAGLTSRAEKAEGEVATLTADNKKLTSDLGSLTSLNVGLTTERDTARSRVTLIESFAKHHNLDLAGLEKFKALKDVPEASASKDGKALYDQWQALKNAGEGKKATAFFRKHKAELDDYAESTR